MHFSGKIYLEPLCGLRSKTISVLVGLIFLLVQSPRAQISEEFSDGDLTSHPAWNGTLETFTINAGLQLQLNASEAGTSWLSTEFSFGAEHDAEWEFYLQQSFSPSSANFGRVYLMSDQADLTGALNGYYLQFGEAGSQDAVELFRQSGTTRVSVCRASDGKISSAFGIRVRVTRSATAHWQLYVNYLDGMDYISEGEGDDVTHSNAAFFGVVFTYTITNATRFYLDDINVRTTAVPDTTPPRLLLLEVTSPRSLQLVFSERLEPTSAQKPENFFVQPGPGHPVSSVLKDDGKTIDLGFAESFTNGYESTITMHALSDLASNEIDDLEFKFVSFESHPVNFRDVIISEIFPDPVPQVSLPAEEFVELYNRGEHPVQLEGWKFTDGASTGMFPPYILLPGHYLIVTGSAPAPEFHMMGALVGLFDFPTLNNSGDRLVLMDQQEMLIDSVNYSDSWYRDDDKESGGWTLERVDPENSCYQKENWKASVDPVGGTPGRQNSVFQIIYDRTGPKLIEVNPVSDSVVHLAFDEKLSSQLPAVEDLSVEPSLGILEVTFVNEERKDLRLKFDGPYDTLQSYEIFVENVFDCPGNVIQPEFKKGFLNRDVEAPFVISALPTSANTLEVLFSETVTRSSAEKVVNYVLAGTHPASAVLGDDDASLVMSFASPFENGHWNSLTIQNVTDMAGNMMNHASIPVLFFEPAPTAFRDVIINEVLADPSPPVALPEAEFVEIFNRSNNPVDLSGWMLSDETGGGLLEHYLLLPGSYLLLSSASNAAKFSPFGEVLEVSSFPSLNNDGDLLILADAAGKVIDSIEYARSWYSGDEADGGWSLERIDPDNICEEADNWDAAEDAAGGTPGRQNSVYAHKPDGIGPKLLAAIPEGQNLLILKFDEELANTIPGHEHFLLTPPLAMSSIDFSDNSLKSIAILLADAIQHGQRYSLKVTGVFDCPGNSIQPEFSEVVFILPEKASPEDVIVSEILFNPRSTGVDFVEIHNRSGKVIDLGNWAFRNVNSSAGLRTFSISDGPLLFHPGEYKVFTEDVNVLKGEYVGGHEETFWMMVLPPFNDDAGSVTLLNEEGVVIDSMLYSDTMHSPLISADEGVSLERISLGTPGNDRDNWRSASSASGFATPGYANSNQRAGFPIDDGSITVEPEIIQPAISSHDFARIRYRFSNGGMVANVKVLDQQGRIIRVIAENALLGNEGFFRWDADRDNGFPARTGSYLVWFEIFDVTGLVKAYKKRVVVF